MAPTSAEVTAVTRDAVSTVLDLTASFIPPRFIIKGSSSPVDINLILPNSLNATCFALSASVNSVQSLWVCLTLSHHMHLRYHGRSEFVKVGPAERAGCWRG